ICTSACLRPQYMGNNAGIQLQEAYNQPPFGKRPQSIGPLATVLAESLSRNHSVGLDSDNPQVSRSCGIQITAYVDPRLRMTRYQNQATIDTADDENGKSVAAAQGGQNNWNEGNCSWQIGMFIPLDYDPTVSHTLKTIKGSIKATVAAEVEKIEI